MKQFERGTVPVAMGTMGYHSATITEKRAMHSDAKYKAALAHALNPPAVPSSADSRLSHTSHENTSDSLRARSAPIQGNLAPIQSRSKPATSTAAKASHALAVIDEGVPSSVARNQSKLLRKGFIPAEIDFGAIADSSVGGNGLPRPYGRFIAPRDGHGLAMWQRIPAIKHDPSKQPGPPTAGKPDPESRNITKMNIERRQFGSRNLRPDLPVNTMRNGRRKDKVTNLPHSLLQIAAEARKRPFYPALGRDYYASRFCNREAGHINLPAASFLSSCPNLPPNVRVDCGRESMHMHLASNIPLPGAEWQKASTIDGTNLPVYHATIVRQNGEVQELSRPPANRERLLHPAVSQFETQRLLGLHYEPASQAQLQQPPPMLPAHQAPAQQLEMDSGPGSTFITQ